MDIPLLALHCEGCRCTFTDPGPLNNHRRGCKPTKKRLNGALGKARDILGSRKRRRLEQGLLEPTTVAAASNEATEIESQIENDNIDLSWANIMDVEIETVSDTCSL